MLATATSSVNSDFLIVVTFISQKVDQPFPRILSVRHNRLTWYKASIPDRSGVRSDNEAISW